MTQFLHPSGKFSTPLSGASTGETLLKAKTSQKQHFGCYQEFLSAFLERGYRFCFFPELRDPFSQLVLRHDIDFDTHLALRMAIQEKALGVRSSFFFLLRSPMYNVLEPQDYENIQRIRELGHVISLHFDPTLYLDFEQGLRLEVEMFRTIFKTDVNIVSLHRPSLFFQQHDAPIAGIEHTYQSRYFRKVKYISDSTGVWRYGHPFETAEFIENKSIHLLIHPIWWMVEGETNLDKLRCYYRQRVDVLKANFSENCIPFRQLNGHL
ncbi:MAG: hypothetical protein RMJ33_09400 [Saprospiraceae bacterium]|nr:hypothetical protein [Saprospiraceae bacterium]MDW8230039.1 hypothetical protein [Saprospiraceae bacterium]